MPGTKKKYTLKRLMEIIEWEGLSYTVMEISSDHISNPEVARLWKAAGDALSALESYIENHRSDPKES